MLVHDAKRNKLIAYDGRETAPAAAKPDRFLDAEGKPLAFYDAVIGGRSVGVPGTVALLAETHKRHGKLPWAKLFEPAIDLAEQRLSGVGAAQRDGGGRSGTRASRARAPTSTISSAIRYPVGRLDQEPGVRGDAAQDRRGRRQGVLRRRDRAATSSRR